MCHRYILKYLFALSLQAKFFFVEIFDSDIWCWKTLKTFYLFIPSQNIFVEKREILLSDCWTRSENPCGQQVSPWRIIIITISLSLSCHYHLEADEDAACDADDEDEAQDDEGGHDDQDHQAVILLRGAEESQYFIFMGHSNINGKMMECINCNIMSMLYFDNLATLTNMFRRGRVLYT